MPSRRNRKTEKNEKVEAEKNAAREHRGPDSPSEKEENPPRTTSKGWLTTPKFGSSTSGGGEIEPGPERD